jgi:hypothetical protein
LALSANWLLEHPDDSAVREALEYARKASEIAPESAEVLDTLAAGGQAFPEQDQARALLAQLKQ